MGNASKQAPNEQAQAKARVDIERAIDTVRTFSDELQVSSSFEKTISFTKTLVKTLSPHYRKEQREKRKANAYALQESVDLIKIYSSALKHMQKGSHEDQELAKKLLAAANTYNEVVRKNKKSSSKIKQFFKRLTGQEMDVELIQSEILIPQFSEDEKVKKQEKFLGHKVTVQKKSRLTGLLETVQKQSKQEKSKPKREEIDAFRLKAIAQYKKDPSNLSLSFDEFLFLIHNTPIELEEREGSYGYAKTVVALSQTLEPFPGEKIEFTGEFQRDSFHPELCFPIKESFKRYVHAAQTGFPHPTQYVGFCLHEKLLPSFLLRPRASPFIQELLEKKHHFASNLLCRTSLYEKAKAIFTKKKALFSHHPELITLLQEVMQAIVGDAKEIDLFFAHAKGRADAFSYIGHIHEEIMEKVIAEPFEVLQKEWLFANNPNISDPAFCHAILENCIKKNLDAATPYVASLGRAIGNAAKNLYLLALSEHLGFAPCTLSIFERSCLISLFRQALSFFYELDELTDEACTREYMERQLLAERNLFTNCPSDDFLTKKATSLADGLIDYFSIG